jgi:hypothetical protein
VVALTPKIVKDGTPDHRAVLQARWQKSAFQRAAPGATFRIVEVSNSK